MRGLYLSGLVLVGAFASSFASARDHPFLFLTAADCDRARQALQDNATFARLAKSLVTVAATKGLRDLPPLERAWWEAARSKPWGATYPEIYHHTFVLPMTWADLARTCARASLLDPSLSLSEKGRQILLELAEYSFEFEHYDVGLNYTVWSAAALEAYDILHDRFSDAERARIDAFFHRFLAAVQKNDDYWVEHEPGGKLNNHYAWHKLAFCMIGLFYDRPELVEQAWHGPKGVAFMLQHGFKDNGLWLEGSIPYQFAATAPLILMAELLENAGHPLSLHRHTTGDGLSLKSAYDALIPLLFPDRVLPAIGDCYARRTPLGEHPDWEVLYRRFRDPVHAWLLADRPTRRKEALFGGLPDLPPAPPPPQTSMLWPEMGYLALRSHEGTNYWSGKGWTVFATFSSQTVHENMDKLSVTVFADGHLWLPDCEAETSAEHSFSAQVQTRLNRETLCHNTLLVDGHSQRHPAQRLDLVEFERLPGLARATFGDHNGQLYPGVRQLRTVIVRDDYVLDFFQATSTQSHVFSWLTHVDGESVASSIRDWQPAQLPGIGPWLYLHQPRRAAFNQRFWETFSHQAELLRLDIWSGGAAKVLACGFPRDDSAEPGTIPMRMIDVSGSASWFLALYRRVTRPDEPVQLDISPGELGSWNVSLQLGEEKAVHTLPRLRAER